MGKPESVLPSALSLPKPATVRGLQSTHPRTSLDCSILPKAHNGTIITSFDVRAAHLPHLEIYGSEGSLSLPDPNTFAGPIQVFRRGEFTWQDVAITRGFTENSRGLGVADMALAIREQQPHRASGELGLHILEVMHGLLESSLQQRHISIQSQPQRPDSLPATSDLIGA